MREPKVAKLIENFLDSPYAIVEVEGWQHCSPDSCSLSLKQTARRYGYRVWSFVKDRKVYLYKEDEYVR